MEGEPAAAVTEADIVRLLGTTLSDQHAPARVKQVAGSTSRMYFHLLITHATLKNTSFLLSSSMHPMHQEWKYSVKTLTGGAHRPH